MRLFLNMLYDFPKNTKLSDVFAKLQQVLAENQWEQQRILFNFHDINDAATENRTPHQLLMKAFPQMKPYWRSAFQEYVKQHPNQKDVSPEHYYSYISNFPGRQCGQPVFPAQDENIDISLMKDIFAKIPRPYSFYSSLAVLDGIDWSGNCDLLPAMNWIVIFSKSEQDDWEAGYWPYGMDFDEICPFYQSNSVRIGKDWNLTPEMTVQVEVYSGQGIALAQKVEDAFAKYFGVPTKRYTRAVYSWEERDSYRAKTGKMKAFFAQWSKEIQSESLRRQKEEKKCLSALTKPVIRTTLKKRFYAANGLTHYPLSRWDDKSCFCKVLPHNYHLEVGIGMDEKQNTLYVECIGCNFELRGQLPVENFSSPDGDRAGVLAFELWQMYLNRFEAEVVPMLFAIFGETPAEFIYDSRKSVRANEETIGVQYCRF